MSELNNTFNAWLVHDESCDYSLTDKPELCNCIMKNVKNNLTTDIKNLFLGLIDSATLLSKEAEDELHEMVKKL